MTIPIDECPYTDHIWLRARYGSGISRGTPLRFCVQCGREEWDNKVVIPGSVYSTNTFQFEQLED